MTASEVMEIVRRAWAVNTPMLRTLYGRGSRTRPPRGRLALRKAALQKAGEEADAAFQAMHAMFFVHTLPIAPSRVRPLQYLNGMVFEHPHNVALAKVGITAASPRLHSLAIWLTHGRACNHAHTPTRRHTHAHAHLPLT